MSQQASTSNAPPQAIGAPQKSRDSVEEAELAASENPLAKKSRDSRVLMRANTPASLADSKPNRSNV